jgi:hypothetical protein
VTPRILSPAGECARKAKFGGPLRTRLAGSLAQRQPKTALSGAFLSEPGDLGDLPARWNTLKRLRFLVRNCGRVRVGGAPPIDLREPFAGRQQHPTPASI